MMAPLATSLSTILLTLGPPEFFGAALGMCEYKTRALLLYRIHITGLHELCGAHLLRARTVRLASALALVKRCDGAAALKASIECVLELHKRSVLSRKVDPTPIKAY